MGEGLGVGRDLEGEEGPVLGGKGEGIEWGGGWGSRALSHTNLQLCVGAGQAGQGPSRPEDRQAQAEGQGRVGQGGVWLWGDGLGERRADFSACSANTG